MGLIIEIAFIVVIIFIIVINIGILITYNGAKIIENETNLSGFEVARILSAKFAEEEPHIIKKKGKFLDYYDSNRNVIKLSPEVFDGTDMYAAFVASGLASLTNKERAYKLRWQNINNFLVMLSYIMIALRAFLNNSNVIYFGMILFIIAFLFQVHLLDIWGKELKDMKDACRIIKKEKVIKPFEEDDESGLVIASVISLARLPYGFINNFR